MTEIIVKPGFREMWERGRLAPHLFAQDFLDINCHTGQIAYLNHARITDSRLQVWKPQASESILSASNRFGKTYVSAIKHLWMAFYQVRPDDYKFDPQTGNLRDYRTVNIAMSLDQAMLSFNYATAFAENAPRFKKFVIDKVGTPFPRLTIGVQTNNSAANWRSDIWARSTAKNARFLLGHTFNYINWDEAAFDIALNNADVLDMVIRMRLIDQAGKLDMTSSPNGFNKFKELWDQGQGKDPSIYSFAGNIFMNFDPRTGKPYVDFNDVKKKMQKMSEDWVTQNVWGLFAKFDNIFPGPAVQACYADQDYKRSIGDVTLKGMYLPVNFVVRDKTLDNQAGVDVSTQITIRANKQQKYVVGVDLARKKDYTVIIVLQIPEEEGEPLRLVYFEMLNKVKWETIWLRIQRVANYYNSAEVMVDSTGLGDIALETLQDQYDLQVDGRIFTSKVKENLIIQLQEYIQNRGIVFPFIYDLVNQLIYYRWEDKGLETDAVMALALALEQAKVTMGSRFDLIIAPDIPVFTIRRDTSGSLLLPQDFEFEPDVDFLPILGL